MHGSVVSDAIAFLLIFGTFALLMVPLWLPLLVSALEMLRDMRRERLIEAREREEREARVRALNAMTDHLQRGQLSARYTPQLPAPPPVTIVQQSITARLLDRVLGPGDDR